MKRQACQLSLILAALAATPAVLAGPAGEPVNPEPSSPASNAAIVKCVDGAGHVTLTDQPCSDGAATVRLDTETPSDLAPARPAVEHFPAPRALPRAAWVKPLPRRPALAGDIATLKAARLQLLLQDEARHQPVLAGLN